MRKTCLIILICISCIAFSARYYVTKNGNDLQSGLSWDQSFLTLTKVLEVASSSDEIWVADGTWQEGAVLIVPFEVSLYGGFSGTETLLSQRNCEVNITIIDGNNSHQCINNGGLIDGVCITGGNVDFGCGGILNYGTVQNCRIYGNNGGPGGVMNYGLMQDSFVYENTSDDTAGVFSDGGTVIRCEIYNNTSTGSCGGISNSYGVVSDCRIFGNSALQCGGIMNSCHDPGFFDKGTVVNCTVFNNTVQEGAGGIMNLTATLVNCTVYGNEGSQECGGIYNMDGQIQSCISWGNSGTDIQNLYSTERIYNVCYGTGSNVTGNGFVRSDPEFVNISGEPSTWDFHLQAGSPCIDAGRDANAPQKDMDGTLRPQGTRVDIGAYEWKQVPLTADFSAGITSGTAPLIIQFNDLSTGSPAGWQWDFNMDGTIDSTEQNPKYVFSESGLFSVRLIVTKDQNESEKMIENYISVAPVDAPELAASFVSSSMKSVLCVGQEYFVEMRFRNAGTQTWMANGDVKLGAVGNDDPLSHIARFILDQDVRYGETASFRYFLTPEQAGTYLSEWQMLKEGSAWFGDIHSKEVAVESESGVQTQQWILFQ